MGILSPKLGLYQIYQAFEPQARFPACSIGIYIWLNTLENSEFMETTVNYHAEAKKSMERISKDFLRIKADYIDKGNFKGALEKWSFSLLEKHFDTLKPYLTPAFKGPAFCVLSEMLTEALVHEDKFVVEYASTQLLACIRQQEMRNQIRQEEDTE
jgi:hypothetical protein